MTWRAIGGPGSAPTGPNGWSGGPSPASGPKREAVPAGENAGWSIFSYLIAGMVAHGLIG